MQGHCTAIRVTCWLCRLSADFRDTWRGCLAVMSSVGSEFGNPLRKFKLVFLGEQSGKCSLFRFIVFCQCDNDFHIRVFT